MPPAACQIRRCLGTLPAQPREVRFFRLELGADRRFFFSKRLNMYLQQQQQQQLYNLKQILNEFVFCLVSFCFLFKFGKDKHDPRRSKTR